MKKLSSIFCFVIVCLCLCISCDQKPNHNHQEEWISLFDGNNYQDWTPKFAGYELGENYKDRFVYEDSMLRVRYTEKDTFKGNFGHLFYKQKFSHYKLKAKYRFVGDQMENGPGWAVRNNGLMLHCQEPSSMGLDQDFPISLELQLLGGNGTDDRTTANLCTPGTNVVMGDSLFRPHCVNSISKTYHGDQWVEVEALVLGDSLVQHIMEDQVVLQFNNPTIGGAVLAVIKKVPIKKANLLRKVIFPFKQKHILLILNLSNSSTYVVVWMRKLRIIRIIM